MRLAHHCQCVLRIIFDRRKVTTRESFARDASALTGVQKVAGNGLENAIHHVKVV